MKNALTLFFLFLSLLLQGQNQELKLTTDIWPPFTDIKGNKSILTVLVQEALYRRNINSSIHIEDFVNLLDRIDKGEFDGVPALWKTPEREAKYAFSEPYLYNQLVLVGPKGSDVSALSFTELKGKRIGVVEYYDYGDFPGKDEVSLIPGKSNQNNLEN